MRIAICEDEKIQQRELKILIEKNDENFSHDIYTYDSGEELIEEYKLGKRFDLILLDVRMKKLNGIETAKLIRKFDERVLIVLTTTLIEYAVMGYSVRIYDFLLKPITEKNFLKVFKRVEEEFKSLAEKKYIIETKFEKVIIDLNEILYIESSGRKLIVVTYTESYTHYRNISEEEVTLGKSGFIRCHRCYLVNLENVYRVKPDLLVLKNGNEIPLSKNKYKQVYDALTKYMLGEI